MLSRKIKFFQSTAVTLSFLVALTPLGFAENNFQYHGDKASRYKKVIDKSELSIIQHREKNDKSDPEWTEKTYSWTCPVPPDLDEWTQNEIDNWTYQAIEFLLGAAVGTVIEQILKFVTTALVGFIGNFVVTFILMIPSVGWPGHTNIVLSADGVGIGEPVVNYPYIAWCTDDPGDEFFVPTHIVVQKKTGWFSWETVASYQVLSQQEANDIGSTASVHFIVSKQPIIFSETGTFRISYGSPDAWWDDRVEEVVINVVTDVVPPTVSTSYQGTNPNTNIYVTFSEDMNASTFTNGTVTVSGSSSGNHPCAFSFNHSTYELMINPNSDFSYGETVTMTLGTSVQDLVGNGLANPYTFSFAIESAPGPDPTSLNLSATLTPSSNIPPYSIVNVNGVVTYNTGYNVPVGAVNINTGENLYTASINDGSFNRNIHAPSSSRNISITANDDEYSLSKTINKWIDIQGNGGTPGYDLTTDMIYDYTDHDSWVEWSPKEAFRTTDEYVDLFAYFDNLSISHDLDLMWRFFYPNGNQYGSDLVWNDAISSSWTWGWATWGFLINGQSMAYNPGRYKAQFYVDGDRKATHYYVVAWDFTEHRLCKDVQTSDPYMPIGETDVFYQTDEKVVTWANFDLVAQEGELKCLFYEPSGALYYEVNSSNAPDYKLPDPATPHSWYDWARAWAWIWIDGYLAADKCGDWHADFYVKNPTSGNWEKYYDEYFRILENPVQNPNISVDADPVSPIETQPITLNVNALDNTYLKKVILYWNDGSVHNQTWDNIYSGSLSQSKNIGSFLAGQEIEYWAVAWDATDNQSESEHYTVSIGLETVSVPNRPIGEAYRKITENGTYNTGGSSTNLGHSVEYQFNWGNGQQSPWGSENQSYSWSNEDIYFVKVRARCQIHTNRVSEWSNAFTVTVDSSNPIVNITTNNGNDFSTNQIPITLEGTANDPNPASGIDSVIISSGDTNDSTLSNWSFTLNLDEGLNTLIVTAIDKSGNLGCDSITIEYDSIPPEIPVLINPIEGEHLNTLSVVFNWTEVTKITNQKSEWLYKWGTMEPEGQNIGEKGNPTASEIRYVLQVDTSLSFSSSAVVDTITNNYDTLILSENNYFWRVKACDLAGNESLFSTPDSFSVDTTAPSASNGLTANGDNPSPWTNDSTFAINWTNPADSSGIAKAFYKLGSAPTSNYDTTGTMSGIPPDTIFSITEGSIPLYIWLEDGAGNVDYNNNSLVNLRYDITAPTGCLALSPDTSNTPIFTVSWSTGTDVLSGLTGRYDVKVKDVVTKQGWVYWLQDTLADSAIYTGTEGHTYYFEAGAHDSVGNIEIFSASAECSTVVDLLSDIEVSDTAHDFGDIAVGDSADWTFNIFNIDLDTLIIDSLTNSQSVYQVAAPSFPQNILPDDTIDVTVRFRPDTIKLFQDTLSIFSSDPDEGVLAITLSGRGVGGDVGPIAIISPPETVLVDSNYTPRAYVTNFGSDTVNSFNITCRIDTSGAKGYSSTKPVSNLEAGDTVLISFADWLVPLARKDYTITVFSQFLYDTIPANDTLSIIVHEYNDAPVISGLPDTSFLEDDSLKLDLDDYVTDVDNPDSVLSWGCAGNDSIIVAIDSVTHIATFSAPQDWNGYEDIIFTVNDHSSKAIVSDTVRITVLPVNDIPVVSGLPDTSFLEDDSLQLDLDNYVTDVDNPDATLNWSYSIYESKDSDAAKGWYQREKVESLPITGSKDGPLYVDIDSITHIATITADSNWNGSRNIIFTAEDPWGLSDSDTMSVTVDSVNDAPVVFIPDTSFNEDDKLMLDLDDYVSDVDNPDSVLIWSCIGNDTITVAIDSATHWAIFFAPENWYGSDSMVFIVDDNTTKATAEASVTITVNSVNDAPEIDSISPESPCTTLTDSAILFSVYAHDVDSDTLTYDWFINGVLDATTLEPTYSYSSPEETVDTIEAIVSDDTLKDSTQWIIVVKVGVAEKPVELPKTFSISQNTPNPFTRSTTIMYQLPRECKVSLRVYDVTGSLIETLVNCPKEPGYYTAQWNAADQSSGIYFVKFSASSFSQTQKLILVR